MKKVLIALDFHPSAKKIIDVGYKMAKAMDAEVILLHVKIELMNYLLTYKHMGLLQFNGSL